MAQKTIKDYFPSRKIQDRGKNATKKRPPESFTVPRSKRSRVTKVLTTVTDSQQADKLKFKDKGKDNNPLCDIQTSLLSTPTTSCNETPDPTREANPAGVKSCSTKLNCSETNSLSAVSPLRRGAECVRLALEKKTSPVTLIGKDKSSRFTETRRKLFSSEVSNDPGVEYNNDSEEIFVKKPTAAESKTDSNISSSPPAKQAVRGVSPLKKTSGIISKRTPKLKHFTSLQYESPTKTDK